MRISDWSSDVCSSDLADLVLSLAELGLLPEAVPTAAARGHERRDDAVALVHTRHLGADLDDAASTLVAEHHAGRPRNVTTLDREVREIGSSSFRETVCPYVYIRGFAVYTK